MYTSRYMDKRHLKVKLKQAALSSTFSPTVNDCWSLICLYFIFKMQENANELQYPEATEASDVHY